MKPCLVLKPFRPGGTGSRMVNKGELYEPADAAQEKLFRALKRIGDAPPQAEQFAYSEAQRDAAASLAGAIASIPERSTVGRPRVTRAPRTAQAAGEQKTTKRQSTRRGEV